MRTLESGLYTDLATKAQITAPSAAFGARFEILEPNLSKFGDLDGVITTASIDLNVDRTVKGSLDLTMVADSRLATALFRKRIKPWARLQMPDGGVAEWPMGVYVWNTPDRVLRGVGADEWRMTLGDQGHVLDAGGPGTDGFTAVAGERVTDAITRAVQTIGFLDATGITPLPQLVAADVTWGLVDEQGQPMTWTRVLTDLHVACGCYSPVFDGNGRYRNLVVPDLATAGVGASYEPGAYSILTSAETSNNLDRIANRVFVVAKNAGAVFGVASLTAEDVIPKHPLARAAIGFYIDRNIDDQVSSTLVDLQLRAYNELLQGLSFYQSLSIETLLNPAHEAFDVIRVAWPNDPEFALGSRWHERGWSVDLFAHTMKHDLSRLVDVT